jgi:hypothetical protein
MLVSCAAIAYEIIAKVTDVVMKQFPNNRNTLQYTIFT